MIENLVVGSGIGGSLIASLLNKDSTLLFEQDKNLGGCASTFKRYGHYFNTGATTFVGYEENHVVKKIFDYSNIIPDIKKSDIAIRVVQNEKQVDRVQDFEAFLEQINTHYPHKNNRVFWSKLKELDEKFWQLQHIYFGKYSFKRYIKTSQFILELLKVFGLDIFQSAQGFIDKYLQGISKEYQNFIDAGLLITVQTTSKNISVLSLVLGLSYPFHDVFYVNGGMGELIKEITKEIDTHTKEKIEKIIPKKDHYEVISNKQNYHAKNVILNSSIYDSGKFFEDKKIKEYYESFSFSDQSAFVVYLTLKSDEEFLHHYQIILEQTIPNSISNSFFISFSDKEDDRLSKNGTFSITISTHTKASFWKNLSKEEYEHEKKQTELFILKKFLGYFDTIKRENIIENFSATSSTFNHYIGRYNCGGKAIEFKNMMELPSCQTPFQGLYNVGDTIFAGQGWPGVALGAYVLYKESK